MKKIYLLLILLLIGVEAYAQNRNESLSLKMQSIEKLREIICDEQIKLSHYTFSKYIEALEMQCERLPTFYITHRIAKQNKEVEDALKRYYELEGNIKMIFNTTRNDCRTHDSLMKFKNYRQLSPQRVYAREKVDSMAIQIYIAESIAKNRFIDFQIPAEYQELFKSAPKVIRINSKISFLEQLIKIEEEQLLNNQFQKNDYDKILKEIDRMENSLEEERLKNNHLAFNRYLDYYDENSSEYQTIYVDEKLARSDPEVNRIYANMSVVNDRLNQFLFQDTVLMKELATKEFEDQLVMFTDDPCDPDPHKYSLYVRKDVNRLIEKMRKYSSRRALRKYVKICEDKGEYIPFIPPTTYCADVMKNVIRGIDTTKIDQMAEKLNKKIYQYIKNLF